MKSTVDGMMIDEDGFNYLQHLHLSNDVSDDSIISLLPHCKRVLSLDLVLCFNITDASITSLAQHCNGLHSMNLGWCAKKIDASIISVAQML